MRAIWWIFKRYLGIFFIVKAIESYRTPQNGQRSTFRWRAKPLKNARFDLIARLPVARKFVLTALTQSRRIKDRPILDLKMIVPRQFQRSPL